MTAEDVSKLFDSLRDTVVSALAKHFDEIESLRAEVHAKNREIAKMPSEVKLPQSRQFNSLQLIMDFQSLQKDVREWKEDARESHATREAPVAQSEAPPKFKQLEKQPRPNCSSRSLARAALQAVCGMVAQHTATEAQKPCPHRGGNSNVTSRGTAHAVQQNGSARDPAARISGKDRTTQDETTQVSSGKVSASLHRRRGTGAETDGLFLRLEAEKGWVFSAGRSGIFCQRTGTEAAVGDGWAKDAWTWRGFTEQGSGSQRTWAKEEQKWSGWNWNSYPSGSGGWVLGCLAKMCHDTAAAMFFRVLPYFSSPPTVQEKRTTMPSLEDIGRGRLHLLRTTRVSSWPMCPTRIYFADKRLN